MGSKQHDSTSSSEAEERSLFTRVQEKVEKAKKSLFEQTEAATHCRTRPSTSAQRPVTDYVSSSLSSYHDDSDQDKTVDPRQFSEESSDVSSRRAEKRELGKKKQTGISSGKSHCFYNDNYFHYGKFCIL